MNPPVDPPGHRWRLDPAFGRSAAARGVTPAGDAAQQPNPASVPGWSSAQIRQQAATRRHNPACPGCREYALLLDRERQARLAYYETGLARFDTLQDLRQRVVEHLKARHPLRTERLKQLGQPLSARSDNTTLLNALTQWESMKDAETRTAVAQAVEQELLDLRSRAAELERQLGQHTDRRHRDEQSVLDRTRGLREQLDKQTAALSQAEQDRRDLAQGFVRLCDHITTRGQALPTLPRPYEWYRQWADQDRPPRTTTTRSQWRAAAKHYQPQWGQALLQRLWSGSAWTRTHLLGATPAPRARSLLQELIEHGLVTVHDPDNAALLTVGDELRTFADDVGAALGPRKPSPADVVLVAAQSLPPEPGRSLLRILATAAKDHNITIVQRKAGALPLLRLRTRQGPAMPHRWLLPWLPGQEQLMRDLLGRARRRDTDTGLVVIGPRPPDGADDHGWGPLVEAAGYDPALAKRLWLDELETPPTA